MTLSNRIGLSALIMALLPAAAATVAPLNNGTAPAYSPGDLHASKTHMLVLKCRTDDNMMRQSRIAVLDTGRAGATDKYDVALVSRHGLKIDSDDISETCVVQDFGGSSEPVVLKRRAPNYAPGKAADWGVIKFKRLRTPGLIRYPLKSMPRMQLASADQAIQFGEARGLPENKQTCNLLARKYSGLKGRDFDGVFAHTCQAVAGQSGAPLSFYDGEADLLVGIHLGHSWLLRSPLTGKPANQPFMRAIDDEMIAQINKILDEIE